VAKVSQAARIGLFVVITAGAGYLVFRTIHRSTGSGGGYVVHAYVNDASGLAKHSRVTIAGIPLASNEDIRLENGQARVDVRVNGDVTLHHSARLGI
jgi:phospholipid/cholesterol/gamma-HCH transport system substrate-binding protein